MMASLRARLFFVLVLLTCATLASVSCSTKQVLLDPGIGAQQPYCPQTTQIANTPPLFATGGAAGFPACGGYSATMTYAPLTPPSDVSVIYTSNVDSTNVGCTPTPSQVLFIVILQPVASFSFAAAPSLTFAPPASSINTSFVYYYCIKDVTTGLPVSPVSEPGVIVNNNNAIVFPTIGGWPSFVAAHKYRVQFYRV